ncbi:MAG TPA: glycine--tRNA ligase subunit beta [Caulobacteraceae bacterium]|jgi:glycyl-tRNA synthetase beta chain
MPQLLLELLSEEIPARMQAGAARELERAAGERFSRAELSFECLTAFAGPRRLSLVVDGLPARQAERSEERKGPRVGAPDAALAGFLRQAGVAREALVERDGVWFVTQVRPGRSTGELIGEIATEIITGFAWPKSMVWGNGSLRWVRPLHRIVCVFDGKVVPFSVDGLASGDLTEGHRFMGEQGAFASSDFASYRAGLEARFVVLDPAERKRRILVGAQALCDAHGLELLDDEGLLEEVAGMAEWPVPLLGAMDASFLDLPPEVIRTTMRTHQRYFAVRAGDGALAPHFIAIANIEAADGGALIAAGSARVLAARLEDARFFWREDRRRPLESRLGALAGITFHGKLGTLLQRVERVESLARKIAPNVGADADLATAAARLAKADLATAMVGEFPELQGTMGGYYARAEGLDPAIADAIADHYKPQGPSEAPPSAPVTVAVALADKIDTILAFFSIGEKPTGSRDPFALRRAALGVIRIILDNRLRLPLGEIFAASPFPATGIMEFFADRLEIVLRERGARFDLVDAVFALGDDDLTRVVTRIEALDAFLRSENGANLLAGYKRASNILAAEARKGPLPDGDAARPEGPPEETALFDAVKDVAPTLADGLAREDFAAALAGLASLRAPVDAFFDAVLVNSANASERDGRLRLLAQVRAAMGRVADFSRVSG